MARVKLIDHMKTTNGAHTNYKAFQYLTIRVNCLHSWMNSKALNGSFALRRRIQALEAAINVICSEMINGVMCVSA